MSFRNSTSGHNQEHFTDRIRGALDSRSPSETLHAPQQTFTTGFIQCVLWGCTGHSIVGEDMNIGLQVILYLIHLRNQRMLQPEKELYLPVLSTGLQSLSHI